MREARTVMADLAASGLSGEQLALVMELSAALAAEARPVADEAAERKRAYDRQYQAERRANRKMSCDSHDLPSPLTPPLKSPPDPQKITPPISPQPGQKARAIRLPDDWKPNKLDRSTVSGGIVQNRGQEWAQRALESFKNHWRSANGPNAKKLDWQATWANWIIEQDRRDGNRPNPMAGTRRDCSGDGLSPTTRAALAVFGPGDPHPVSQ